MTKVVIDTNIIFSLLLNKNKKMRDFFFEEDLEFYCCKYTIIELFKHKEKIKKYSLLLEEELIEFLYFILKRVNIFDEFTLSPESINEAYKLCIEVDENDIPFVALAIELEALLWTGDKKLKKALKDNGFNLFFEV